MSDALAREATQLSAEDLTKAFKYATDWLGVFVDEVNALNVYPVPDGDTGTNMHLTMQSVRRQLAEDNPDLLIKDIEISSKIVVCVLYSVFLKILKTF